MVLFLLIAEPQYWLKSKDLSDSFKAVLGQPQNPHRSSTDLVYFKKKPFDETVFKPLFRMQDSKILLQKMEEILSEDSYKKNSQQASLALYFFLDQLYQIKTSEMKHSPVGSCLQDQMTHSRVLFNIGLSLQENQLDSVSFRYWMGKFLKQIYFCLGDTHFPEVLLTWYEQVPSKHKLTASQIALIFLPHLQDVDRSNPFIHRILQEWKQSEFYESIPKNHILDQVGYLVMNPLRGEVLFYPMVKPSGYSLLVTMEQLYYFLNHASSRTQGCLLANVIESGVYLCPDWCAKRQDVECSLYQKTGYNRSSGFRLGIQGYCGGYDDIENQLSASTRCIQQSIDKTSSGAGNCQLLPVCSKREIPFVVNKNCKKDSCSFGEKVWNKYCIPIKKNRSRPKENCSKE